MADFVFVIKIVGVFLGCLAVERESRDNCDINTIDSVELGELAAYNLGVKLVKKSLLVVYDALVTVGKRSRNERNAEKKCENKR